MAKMCRQHRKLHSLHAVYWLPAAHAHVDPQSHTPKNSTEVQKLRTHVDGINH
jgi:hypothetical protein